MSSPPLASAKHSSSPSLREKSSQKKALAHQGVYAICHVKLVALNYCGVHLWPIFFHFHWIVSNFIAKKTDELQTDENKMNLFV